MNIDFNEEHEPQTYHMNSFAHEILGEGSIRRDKVMYEIGWSFNEYVGDHSMSMKLTTWILLE